VFENSAKNGENPIMNSVTVRESLLFKYYHHNADEMKENEKNGTCNTHVPKLHTKFQSKYLKERITWQN
jgi:CRISPR/Cas system CSM-associated protein Csm5 (group 7 of RAMP superfamily)